MKNYAFVAAAALSFVAFVSQAHAAPNTAQLPSTAAVSSHVLAGQSATLVEMQNEIAMLQSEIQGLQKEAAITNTSSHNGAAWNWFHGNLSYVGGP